MFGWAVLAVLLSLLLATLNKKGAPVRWFSWLAIGGMILLALSPVVYLYPPGRLDDLNLTPPVVTFEGDKMVYKSWGMFDWPWDKKGILLTRCRPVGSSFAPGFRAEEVMIILEDEGILRLEKFQPELCLDNSETFFVDRSRRLPDSFEAGWKKADRMAVQAFFSPEMIALRHSSQRDEEAVLRHRSSLVELFKLGFVVHEKRHTY